MGGPVWKWSKRHHCFVRPSPVAGIFERQTREGAREGYVVRTRIVDPTTGKPRELKKILPVATIAMAHKWLEEETNRIRAGMPVGAAATKTRFAEFVASLFERKVKVGDIKSAAGRNRWAHVLKHLIEGVTGESGLHARGFGEMFVDRIKHPQVQAWKEEVATLIAAGDYAPTTANGWLAILRVIAKAIKREFDLPWLATEGVSCFDESEHVTYSEEEPNALLPGEVAPFLLKLRAIHPEHYAMVYVGLITGLRPSSLRPLRRRGDDPDVLWDCGRLRVRRSHTLHDEVMRTTKQKRRYAIDLPAEAMEVLRWHVETQLRRPEQQDSDLLFPAVNGSFRSPSVLNKPLADVVEELNLGKKITQRALRRTFNDLARAAQVNDLVTRSISGHQTEEMQRHYSTVNPDEQRAALAKVIAIVDRRTG